MSKKTQQPNTHWEFLCGHSGILPTEYGKKSNFVRWHKHVYKNSERTGYWTCYACHGKDGIKWCQANRIRHREIVQKRYNARREQALNGMREQRIANLAFFMLKSAKTRAKKKGLAFGIDIHDINIPQFCPVFGTKLKISRGYGPSSNSPSLDRVNNSLGYVKGNVRVISWRANQAKKNLSVSEMESLLAYMKS